MNSALTWVVEDFSKESSHMELITSIKEMGYNCVEILGDYRHDMVDNLNGSLVIVCGSIQMCKLIGSRLKNSKPVVYSNFENYTCTKYYSYFGDMLFNDKYAIMTLSELKRRKFEIYGLYARESTIFIRPDSGEKTFQARLLDLIDFDRFYEANRDLEHELVLVSTPKNIKWEGRFLVDGKKIISHSTYQFGGLVTKIPSVPKESKDFCEAVMKANYYPDDVYCIDLCQAEDGKYYLMELTSFSSAGLYAMNKTDVVNGVSNLIMEKYTT